jgi:hypothetical protein
MGSPPAKWKHYSDSVRLHQSASAKADDDGPSWPSWIAVGENTVSRFAKSRIGATLKSLYFQRGFLKLLMSVGFLIIPIGPIARMQNEGFGDSPGPISVSNYWTAVSWILVPLGSTIVILSGIALFIVDCIARTREYDEIHAGERPV